MILNDEGTTFVASSAPLPIDLSWEQINHDEEESAVRAQIQTLIRDVPYPWRSVELISPSVKMIVMDVLQQGLNDASYPNGYRTTYIKCLLALSKARNIVLSSFFSRDVTREGTNPVGGGGYADIWKGHLHDTQVCLKALRVNLPEKTRAKLLRDFCLEALVWRQLRHPNILPFLGVSKDLFAPSYCLISPWMVNGNIMSYLEAHPDHDRLTSLIQVAEGMKYLHNHDPPIVHADIRGANILVTDDRCCCLADFGLSLFVESQALDNSSRISNGSIRWLAPEYMDSTLFDQSYLTARDIYAYGCTVIEIFTGKPPFSDIKNEAGVMHEVVTKQSRPPRPPLNVFPDDKLWSLVTACLTNISSRRPDARRVLGVLLYGLDVLESAFIADSFETLDSRSRWINDNDPILVKVLSVRHRRRRRNASSFESDDELTSSSSSLLTGPSGPNDDAFFVPWPDCQEEATMAEVPYPEASLDVRENGPRQVTPPDLVQRERSTSTPSISDAEGEATPTPQNLSTQTTPSNGKRRRSSSPPSPGSHSTSPTVHTKPENIHLEPSQTNEGSDIHHAKRVRMGEPADEDVLTSPPGKIPTP